MLTAHWVRARGGARWKVMTAGLLASALLVAATAHAVSTSVVAQWLGSELVKLPGSRAPGETREAYVDRAHQIAAALAEEAVPFANGTGWSTTEIAAAGAVIWYSETLLDKRIQVGEEHPKWNQDHGLAKCGMQLHASGLVPQEVWEKLVGEGLDPMRLCAQYGLRVLVAQAKQCGVFLGVRADRTRVAKAFASYASGGRCSPSDRDWQRADLWIKMMANRPDHAKKKFPGYRRVGPAEVPPDVRTKADDVVRLGGMKVGEEFVVASYKLVVEKHAEGKVGVSVFVKE